MRVGKAVIGETGRVGSPREPVGLGELHCCSRSSQTGPRRPRRTDVRSAAGPRSRTDQHVGPTPVAGCSPGMRPEVAAARSSSSGTTTAARLQILPALNRVPAGPESARISDSFNVRTPAAPGGSHRSALCNNRKRAPRRRRSRPRTSQNSPAAAQSQSSRRTGRSFRRVKVVHGVGRIHQGQASVPSYRAQLGGGAMAKLVLLLRKDG